LSIYDCNIHYFQNLGNRKLQDELREKTPNMVAVLLDNPKLRIYWPRSALLKGYDLRDISLQEEEVSMVFDIAC
jgi:hypothetical protein